MTIDVLPAARGDCLLVECRRRGRPWRLLVDGGMPETWPTLRRRLAGLPSSERILDLVVVTHIDSDHIGGALPMFTEPDAPVTIDEVWFNAYPQLPGGDLTPRSAAEGEALAEQLGGGGRARAWPWNVAFERAAVMTGATHPTVRIQFPDGPTITLLGPTPARLRRLRRSWEKTLGRVMRGEADEPALPPSRERLDDLERLAGIPTAKDTSVANGSSIAFLLEHEGASCLLTGDAFFSDLGRALTDLANERGGHPIPIDVFKLSHHGSKSNVVGALIELVPARHYVISTNGERFHHPDDIALARVVTCGPPGLTLWFNYATEANRRWDDPGLRARYGFRTRYPVAAGGDLRIEVPAA